jgi:hypothetical protein
VPVLTLKIEGIVYLMLFITLALSSILIALIVIALKKHQQLRHKDLAERDQALPPLHLSSEELSSGELTPEKLSSEYVSAEDASSNDISSETTDVGFDPSSVTQTASAKAETEPNVSDFISVQLDEPAEDWKEACKKHRQAQRFDTALFYSEQAWPQSQSYDQAAITIRAAIKQAQRDESPDLEKWLAALYRAGTEFSLLYDKIPSEPDLRWQTIALLYTRDDLSKIALPWLEIGVNGLRLLTKTDRKLMTQLWGEPRQHMSAKIYHKPKKHT